MKSVKAKENSVKKTIAKGVKGGTGGGGGSKGGPNSGKKSAHGSSFVKTIKAIKDKELLPCIVFAFSRAKTVELAESLEGNFDFTDVNTKSIIRRFIK
jgi:superfamily II RNA helicase